MRRIVGSLAIALMLATAPSALALPSIGVVSVDKSTPNFDLPTYTGYLGSERLVITTTGTAPSAVVEFRDLAGGTILSSESQCSGSGSSIVRCSVSWGIPGVTVSAGPGNDTIDLRSWPPSFDENTTVHGDDGNDTILGGAAGDIFFGEAGADLLRGGGGDDFLHGGRGADRLYGDSGDDYLIGGEKFFSNPSDFLDCGLGNDVASWTAASVALNCERRF